MSALNELEPAQRFVVVRILLWVFLFCFSGGGVGIFSAETKWEGRLNFR